MITETNTLGNPELARPISGRFNASRLRSNLLVGSALLAGCISSSALAQTAMAGDIDSSTDGQTDIVVTATRRGESISRVPINITALSQEKMDSQGIRSIDDIARLTPDLTFSAPPGPTGGFNTISIRGISSSAGAPTTGVYIDDTPVQPRTLLYSSTNAFPKVFDLERVEVLRGPQGTLFGAGAEGGAIRFLTPQPGLETFSGYARSEVATTRYGGASYELGAAIGGPIVKDVLGFRISAYARRDGGWIDRVSPDTGRTVDKNSNYQNTTAFKAALTLQPVEGLMITPSVYYQKVFDNDVSQIWENTSNPSKGVFQTQFRDGAPTKDTFVLPSLRISYDAGSFQIISNTSYFDRKQTNSFDYTNYVADLRFGDPFRFDPEDTTSPQLGGNNQKNWTQELRVQSKEPLWGIIDWTVGGFYSLNKQSAFLDNVTGSAALKEIFGADTLVDGIYGSVIDASTRDEQLAAFANIDAHVTSKLKVQLGVRVSKDKFSFNQTSDGPINGGFSAYSGGDKETTVTPKFGVSYQASPGTMVYASAGKGYRTGGAQQPVPADAFVCGPDLAGLGLTASPTSYASDSLWSYEVGAKSRLFGGKLFLDGSVYKIKWSNIQQRVTLPTCGYIYVDNLGSATSQGFDLSATLEVTKGLTLGVSAGYVDVKLDETVAASPTAILGAKGDAFGGPPWVVTVSGDYAFAIGEETQGYGRFDFTYRSQSPSGNPAVFTYDPDVPGAAENTFSTIRFGVRHRGIDASIFVKNLTNEVKILERSHDFVGGPLFYSTTNRPRTIGLTVAGSF